MARIAIVAGPDAGHAFPALALASRFTAAGDEAIVYTGARWIEPASRVGLIVEELPGLAVVETDDDDDAGAKLSVRASRIATALRPWLDRAGTDAVIADVITVGGGWAAELAGLPWIELSPHPLYQPSRGLPPIGSGLAPGHGLRGRLRDAAMRTATGFSIRQGERQRAQARERIGLAGVGEPVARLIATLPALEVRRPDWPDDAHLIGPLLWEPTDETFARPDGPGPLIMIAPSTAVTGAEDMVGVALRALAPAALGRDVRIVVSGMGIAADRIDALCVETGRDRASLVVGLGRQDDLLAGGAVAAVICGGGHGMLAKSLAHGVPVVTVPGGGDQWELANRVARWGAGPCVRPVTEDGLRDAVRTVLDDAAYADRARAVQVSAGGVVDPVAVTHRIVGAPVG